MNQVWHIYYATKGTSGAYIDALLKASAIAGVNSCAFVSSHYRYKFGKTVKCFFPITDAFEKRNLFVKLLRGLELTLAYTNILILAMFSRPVIVIHLIDDLNVTFSFFKLCRMLGLKVRITCHDVGSHYAGMNSLRRNILTTADELVVHNNSAAAMLTNVLGDRTISKIKQYPFPYSAFDEIMSIRKQVSAQTNLRNRLGTDYYLFLGVVRNSKGIDTLVESWQLFNRASTYKLVIAGKWTDPDESIRTTADSDQSIIVIDRYLDDEEFVQLIQDARFVVLPYHNYAHSAIINSCANHGGAVLISDIPLFTQMLCNYPLTFRQGDADSLTEILEETAQLNESEITELKEQLRNAVAIQNEHLVEDLKAAYRG